MADLILPALASNNPFEIAKRSLIARLLSLRTPMPISAFPYPDDFDTVADHLREAAAIFDSWLADIGREVRPNAPCRVDAKWFDGSFTEGADSALYEVVRCAEVLREEHEELGIAS
jgi:hypothetical protein